MTTGRGRTMLHLMDSCTIGAAAEEAAAEYLNARGFKVIARNLRCRMGELDIVGFEGDVLVVVEVRMRGRSDFGGALASVNHAKRRRLVRAACYQWQREPTWRHRHMRFDVVALQGRADRPADILWIKDAFRAT